MFLAAVWSSYNQAFSLGTLSHAHLNPPQSLWFNQLRRSRKRTLLSYSHLHKCECFAETYTQSTKYACRYCTHFQTPHLRCCEADSGWTEGWWRMRRCSGGGRSAQTAETDEVSLSGIPGSSQCFTLPCVHVSFAASLSPSRSQRE